eukprot:163605-Amphidinium_carterae.1
MKQRAKQNILLNDVGLEAEATPIEAHVEVAIAIEIIRAKENVEIANGMNDDENEQEHGGASKPEAVVGELQIVLTKDGEENLLHEAKHH